MPRYIEQLTENITPASGDWLWIVDVDAGATDQDRKLSVGKLALLATANVFSDNQRVDALVGINVAPTTGQQLTVKAASASTVGLVVDTAASPTAVPFRVDINGVNAFSVAITGAAAVQPHVAADKFSLDASSSFVSVANDAVFSLTGSNNFSGMILITEDNTGDTGLFLIGGNTCNYIGSAMIWFTDTKDYAERTNVYWETNSVQVQNKRGVAIQYRIMTFRTRAG